MPDKAGCTEAARTEDMHKGVGCTAAGCTEDCHFGVAYTAVDCTAVDCSGADNYCFPFYDEFGVYRGVFNKADAFFRRSSAFGGPTRARTKDPLIMSQLL